MTTSISAFCILTDEQNIFRIDAHISEECAHKKTDLYIFYWLRKLHFLLNLSIGRTDRQTVGRTDIFNYRIASLLIKHINH